MVHLEGEVEGEEAGALELGVLAEVDAEEDGVLGDGLGDGDGGLAVEPGGLEAQSEQGPVPGKGVLEPRRPLRSHRVAAHVERLQGPRFQLECRAPHAMRRALLGGKLTRARAMWRTPAGVMRLFQRTRVLRRLPSFAPFDRSPSQMCDTPVSCQADPLDQEWERGRAAVGTARLLLRRSMRWRAALAEMIW